MPNPANPQNLNRFGYVVGNPILHNDPTGHTYDPPCLFCNKVLWDYSSLPVEIIIKLDNSIALNLGCFIVGCRVDKEAHAVKGPTKTEYMSRSVPGPMADVQFSVGPGPFAGKSIPARGTSRAWTAEEVTAIDQIGMETGCHTCGTTNPGTKSGHFVPDHQPPSSLNFENKPQRLYPQCINCSRKQGGVIT